MPRLSEKVIGAQEAALRELLRQLQSGDAERALRRAPVAVADPGSPGRIDGGSRLAEHGTGYSLRDLLGSGSGGGAAWLGGGNVWDQLAAEYRRLAEEAVRRGDYRRAAYIWGVLLRNVRQAAHVLDAGGLHRDAAILYRDKVADVPAAARCFERAGCWDEAVVLYQQLQEYEKAGDVFRRIGDEDAALAMYIRAAERLAERGRHAAAGDLMRDKAGLPDRAATFYAVGWEAGSDTLACGLRLLDYRVYAEAWAGVRELVAEAGERFVPPRAGDAGRFFAAVVRHTAHAMPDDLRAELKDCARLALAEHLRYHARTSRHQGSAVSKLFGAHEAWPGPVVRDAREALKRALGPAPAAEPTGPVPFRLLDGPITAAVVARESFDLVVGNEAGAVVLLTGRDGRVIPVAPVGDRKPVALAASPDGRHVAVLRDDGALWLESIIATGGRYEGCGQTQIDDYPDELPYLQPEIETDGATHVIWLRGPDADRKYTGPALLTRTFRYAAGEHESTAFCVPEPPGHWVSWGGRSMMLRDGQSNSYAAVPWRPAVPAGSAFEFPPLDWLRPRPRVLELVGVAEDGAVYWSEFRGEGRALAVGTATRSVPAGYRAACLTGPGLLAAVTAENELHWLRADGSPVLRPWGTPRKVDHPAAAVFAAHRPAAGEVAVVFADGWAVRVPKS